MRKSLAVLTVFYIFPTCYAHAGGFLADIVRGTGIIDLNTAQQLDNAHRELREAAPNYNNYYKDIGKNTNSKITEESLTCVTPVGICTTKEKSLKGTRCFCEIDSKLAYGVIN